MRELFIIDSFHYKGLQTPLIITILHARLRQHNCQLFNMCFQTLITLLTLSSCQLTDQESPAKIVEQMLPQKEKFLDKSIERTQSRSFVVQQHCTPVDLTKGYQLLQEQLRLRNIDYIKLSNRLFKIPVPIVARLAIITQLTLQKAVLPVGKRYNQAVMSGEVLREFQYNYGENEKFQKHIRKYRAVYWAINQIDESICKMGADKSFTDKQLTEVARLMKERFKKQQTRVIKAQTDSGESEELDSPVIDAQLDEYDTSVPPITYQLLQLRSKFIPDSRAKDKLIKIDCKSGAKPLMQFAVDMFCKK